MAESRHSHRSKDRNPIREVKRWHLQNVDIQAVPAFRRMEISSAATTVVKFNSMNRPKRSVACAGTAVVIRERNIMTRRLKPAR